MDATIAPTYYSKQGLLLQGEVRNRFDNGDHTLRFAFINQNDPSAFTAGTSDAHADTRVMVASKAKFEINPRWTFGWNAMVQSDNNFSKTYKLTGVSETPFTNEAYLTGIGKRNFFDLRGYYFNIQDTDYSRTAEKQQAIVYPSLDYKYYAPEAIAGGEFSITSNLTNLSRQKDDFYTEANSTRFRGIEGSYSRFTTEAEWKRTFTNRRRASADTAARGAGRSEPPYLEQPEL